MPISIGLDISQVVSPLKASRRDVDAISQRVVESVTYAVYEQIHKEANSALKSTRRIYKQNINTPQIGRLKGSITLTGMLPNMLEQGSSAFNMKTGFKKSPKAKRKTINKMVGGQVVSETIWYMSIPFRVGTPEAIAESEAFSSKMPQEIYDIVKKFKPQQTAFGGQKTQARQLTISELSKTKYGAVYGKRDEIKERAENLDESQRASYTHVSPKFAGLQRQQKTYEAATQGKYVMFRRVSSKSAPNSWIHRGFKPYDLMLKAYDNVDIGDIAVRAVSSAMRNIA